MSVTSRKVQVYGWAPALTIRGSVSGDVTTITSITYAADESDWLFGIRKGELPSTLEIDGVKYKWTVNSYYTLDGMVAQGTWVRKATLNIGTRLVIRKPFFNIKNGNGYDLVFSFYDLGKLSQWRADFGAYDFEIDGKTSVPINIENTYEESGWNIELTNDATYRFTWKIGTRSYQLTRKSGGKSKISVSYTIPKQWNDEVVYSTVGTCELKVEAIFGTFVYASMTQSVKASVPDDCVPKINSISVADTRNRVPAAWGMFVQENSNVAIKAIDYATSYGAPIVLVTMTVNDRYYKGNTTDLPSSDTLDDYGVMDITVTITDTRGRTAEKKAKITVVEYKPPTLRVDTMRCGKDGSIENEGVYFLASTDSTYSTCNGKNKPTLTVQYKLTSDWMYKTAAKALPIGEASTVCAGDLDTEYTYDVRYVLKDQFNTVTVIDFVSTAVYLMHFMHGGRGVAFGSKATVENAADFVFDAIFRGDVKFMKADGSEVTMQQILNKIGL